MLQHRPDLLLGEFNACLKGGILPSHWKVARLALIIKEKNDLELPSSYRPYCMLETTASYDSLLKLNMPEVSRLVGYAYDIAALVTGRTVKQDQANLEY